MLLTAATAPMLQLRCQLLSTILLTKLTVHASTLLKTISLNTLHATVASLMLLLHLLLLTSPAALNTLDKVVNAEMLQIQRPSNGHGNATALKTIQSLLHHSISLRIFAIAMVLIATAVSPLTK